MQLKSLVLIKQTGGQILKTIHLRLFVARKISSADMLPLLPYLKKTEKHCSA